jgi:hypothetical protein
LYANPCNGIESGVRAHTELHSYSTSGIHAMELKGQPDVIWFLEIALQYGIRAMELKEATEGRQG